MYKLLFITIFLLAWFFIISALIMVTYNNSLVRLNDNFKQIDYNTSMVFVLFLIFLTMIIRVNTYKIDLNIY